MLKKVLSLFISLTLLSSCATVVTKSELHDVAREPVKTQFENCIVRFGNYGYRYQKGYQIVDATEEGGFYHFKKSLEKNYQFGLMCRKMTFEKLDEVQLSDPFDQTEFVGHIEKRQSRSGVPVFSFYKKLRPVESPYMYWGLFYVATLGFLPLATPEEESFWLVRHNPGELRAQAKLIENKRWRWWWTPFYLNPYSEKTPTDIKSDSVTQEALTKAFNGG